MLEEDEDEIKKKSKAMEEKGEKGRERRRTDMGA